jgi:hypothetical protein
MKPTPREQRPETEQLELSRSAEFLLNECRMVLPGIQTLLGFQLIAVFSPGFDQKLGSFEQHLHLVAIALVALAVAIIMTPAAYSRQTGLHVVTEGFVRLSTRLLLASMLPLALGICIEFYLIADVLLGRAVSALLAGLLFAVFMFLWFVLPRARRLRSLLGGDP